MNIKLKVAQAQEKQLADASIREEFISIQHAIDSADLSLEDGTVCLLYLEGVYRHSDRKMTTGCLFINMLEHPISELHGVLRVMIKNRDAEVAKATLNFDNSFMGVLNKREALLVHLNLPVKGLYEDERFGVNDVACSFDDVRVTFKEESNNEGSDGL